MSMSPGDTATHKRPAASSPPQGPKDHDSEWRADTTARRQPDLTWLRASAAKHERGLQSALAFLIYAALALIFFWVPIIGAPPNTAIGLRSPDVEQNLWFLHWWPYAISQHLNPFLIHNMWIPYGYNLAWQTSFPLLALLVWPITATAGVVAAYNVLFLSAFVLTAWSTFILCRYVIQQFWAALVGGYLFGFSGYMIAQSTTHIFLIVLFFIPISVYLYLVRRDGKMSRLRYVVLQSLPLAGFFLTTIEMFTLYVLFLWGAIALYFLLAPDERRATFTMALETVGAFLLTGVICSPYLYYMITGGYEAGAVHSLTAFSGDIFGFFIPSDLFLFLPQLSNSFTLAGGNTAEMDSYLGLPLLLIMVAFAVRYWSKPIGKVLIAITLVAAALTLGPYLQLDGTVLMRSPMGLAFKLPIIEKSLPIRYALFVSFAGALMAAVWIAQQVRTLRYKALLGLLACLTLLPNLLSGQYVEVLDFPAFFSTSMYQQYIKPNDTVLVLPISYGHDMLWQQKTNYYFTLAAGYGGEPPHSDHILPGYYLFATGNNSRDLVKVDGKVVSDSSTYYLEHFIVTRHVDDIILGESAYAQLSSQLGFLHETPQHVGGIWYFHTPLALLAGSMPGQVVPGDSVPRPYSLAAAQWNDTTHLLEVPAHTSGNAADTLADAFPSGHYSALITITSASPGDVAQAYVAGTGKVTSQALRNGETRVDFDVPPGASNVQIKIVSLGTAAFTIGDTIITRAG